MLFLILLTLLAFYLFHNFYWKRKDLPPGPTPLPLIGNLLDFIKHPPGEDIQLEWHKKYNGIFTFWLGSRPIVAVSDFKMIIDSFQKDAEAFAGRGHEVDYFNLVRGGVLGVIFIEGNFWREQRRFSLQVLRDFGLGKNLLQERMLEEIQALFSRINAQIDEGNTEIGVDNLIDISVGSIINALLFGYRYTDDKIEEFNDLKKRAQTFIRVNGHPVQRLIRDYPHIYKYLPYFKNKLAQAKDSVEYLHKFFQDRVNEHQKDLKDFDLSDKPPSDFVEAFIQEWERKKQTGEANFFSNKQLIVLLFDLWVAGQETTSNTLQCFVAHLIHNPNVEKKAHEELDRVIGSDRLVTMDDKVNLVYINALVMEVQRVANLLAINLLHRTTKDVKVGDYLLKKGTWCVPQLCVLFINPEIYPNPKQFNPDRFIENGKIKTSNELIPFSIGKRACLGEGLARMELFLFIANLLNQYRFLPGKQMPNLQRNHGVTVSLNRFTCNPQRRFT
ncbi:Cytochrome P450-33C9 [Aphelenchoides bicaudatus]|nr:Cytochrome P450-33C9 [Aphelenchoides bicaudatus]